ncbi:MAG: recombinase [Clostridiaceae bacterium]
MLFHAYLEGDSLVNAGKKAGIEAFHAGIGQILRNANYLGNEYYPAILDPCTFAAADTERSKRAKALGRIWEPKEEAAAVFPTAFCKNEGTQQLEDPFQQAEYAYSLIESVVE